MRGALRFLFALVALAMPASAQELPGGGPTPLLYLHPLVNYREDPVWTREWERGLQRGNSLRVNVGSVSTDDFLTDVELHVTEPISSHFRVLYDMRWFEGLHIEDREPAHFLGFEFAPGELAGFQLQVHPTSRKEEVDLRAGVLLHDESREQYARVSVRWDDFLFEEKNDLGGTSGRVATSLEWTARGKSGPIEVFSRGSYGSTAFRSFPDSTKVPDVLADSEGIGGSVSRVRWISTARRFLEFEILHHEFKASRILRPTGEDESYCNQVLDLVLRGVWGINPDWRVRGEMHRLDQRARSSAFEYDREEWMPAIWVLWAATPVHRLEVGYMGTDYQWEGAPSAPAAESGYRQKLALGWLIQPSDRARVKFSLSHEPDPQRFGGANVQVQVAF